MVAGSRKPPETIRSCPVFGESAKETLMSISWLKESRFHPQNRFQQQESQFFDFVPGAESKDPVVPIDNVSCDLFQAMLGYIYTGNLPDNFTSDVEATKELLDVADRFGCIDLKLTVEYKLATVHLTELSAVDLFLYADAHFERGGGGAVPEVFTSGKRESEGWTMLQESPELSAELLDALIYPSPSRLEEENVRMWSK